MVADLFFSRSCNLAGTKALVRFFKNPHQVRDIVRTFLESSRIPFAAWRREEVTAVHVDCGRNLFQWIGNRMYYRVTEGMTSLVSAVLAPNSMSPLSLRR